MKILVSYVYQSKSGLGFGYKDITMKSKLTAEAVIDIAEFIKKDVGTSVVILNIIKLEA